MIDFYALTGPNVVKMGKIASVRECATNDAKDRFLERGKYARA